MKVALYGNTCNNFFAVARALRPAGIDAHLFIDADANFQQLPEAEDPDLRRGYPEWIHKGWYQSVGARVWPGASPLVRQLQAFDLVMVSGAGVRFAPFVNRPFIFYVTGWDLTVAPFPWRFLTPSRGLAANVSALIGGFWQRRGIGAVDQLWSQPFSPFTLAAERLRVPRDRVVPRYFPIMIDTDLFRCDPAARDAADPMIRQLVDHHDFLVFHPSRIMTNASPRFVDTGQWKGNDRLIEGFARFVRANPAARPALVLIDRGISPDAGHAKELVRALGIERQVVWLTGPHPHGFDRAELLPLYSVADVVADEFGIGWFGSVVVEGLSMGKPVLCYLDDTVMRQLYPWHPILTPRTADEIAASLTDLWRNPEERRRIGEKGRRWALDFHSLHGASERYVRQVRELFHALQPAAALS
jgi:glycosyltransferase involved in cell wall biosynthesis